MPVLVARRVGAARGARSATIDYLFFTGLNFIVLTTNLLVADYLVAVSNFMLAMTAALVVEKAVLVANKMSLLRRYDRAPLIQPILYIRDQTSAPHQELIDILQRLAQQRGSSRS
jgi:hypothetical protein